MPVSLHLHRRGRQVAAELERALNAPGDELAPAALAIARVEYPSLDARRYLHALDRLGTEAARRLRSGSGGGSDEALRIFNEYLYDEQGFCGNREQYDDPRNSFLNEVLDRRTGIPISLAVVYLEVARRAGVQVSGVNFPGHFLLRTPARGGEGGEARTHFDFHILDPFHGGARLDAHDCVELLRQHVGDAPAFDESLLDAATRHEIVGRMLVNLKRLYIRMRSFPQARLISDLLLTVNPSAVAELRDRGLLAYHLEDFAAALRDLEAYLRLLPRHGPTVSSAEPTSDDSDAGTEEASEQTQIWEHVKTLRRRVAGFN